MVRPLGAVAAQPYRLPQPVPTTSARPRTLFRLTFVLLLTLSVAGGTFLPHRTVSAQSDTLSATTDLNLRAQPWIGSDVLTVVPAGGSVSVTGGEQNGFTAVAYNGTSGFAYSDYLGSGWAGDLAGDATAGAVGSAVVASALNLRSDASTSSAVLTVMPGGASVSLLGQRQNGFALVSWQGQQGWAYEDYLGAGGGGGDTAAADTSQSRGSAPDGQVWATSAVNVRSGPGTSYAVLTVMPEGASATGGGQSQNGFWAINYNGTQGWSSSDFLSTSGGAAMGQPPANAGSVDQSAYGGGEGQIIQLIYNAADSYGQSRADMLRVARCESVLDPTAVNVAGGSYGLFQFIPSTWASTPYAQYDIFDPWANANAAAWMWSQGRRNEWVCQ